MLVLALAFEKNFAKTEKREAPQTAYEIAEKSFGALNKEDFELVKTRAEALDGLTEESRENWREMRLDKIRGRGRVKRLDENINPSQIVELAHLGTAKA